MGRRIRSGSVGVVGFVRLWFAFLMVCVWRSGLLFSFAIPSPVVRSVSFLCYLISFLYLGGPPVAVGDGDSDGDDDDDDVF